jgi:hypothetical protein
MAQGAIGFKGLKDQYDHPFNPQNLKTLYKMRPAEEPASVTLIIQKVGYDGNPLGHPYQVEKYEDFAKPFQELWDYLSTPKYRLDRGYGDNLQDSPIK